ncbi:MAG: DUF4340 domain-containing protein [Acidimicrobiia bacterium]|nr:DUF4340 domain-containing protein [Acidimicrobiia bacterium]
MQLRGLLAAAGVLALLAGGVWYSNKLEKEKEGKPAPDAPPKILEIPADQIRQIDIAKGPETTTLKRASDGKWQVTAPQPLRADQDNVSTLVNTFSSLSSERLIEEKASSLAGFGLDSPALSVNITKKDGKTSKLLIGNETPTGGGVFAKLDGDPRVFTLASWNKSSLDKTSKDLRDKRLLTFDSDKLTRVELTVKGQTVEFGKNNQNEWQIVRPKPMRADGGQVEELVRKLRDAKMDTDLAEDEAKKIAAAYSRAQLVAIARATDAAGTQQLEVRKSKDNTYYAKSDAVEGIHKATSDLGDGLNKSTDDFRNKKLFDFGWSDPSQVELRDGDKTRKLEKASDKWMEANKQMDSTSVQSLIDKLRDLSAAKFPDSGFTTPIVEATVTSNEGKRVEKVLISQAGDRFIAKRDNEPALYELDKTAVDELRKAAADVKEPPPPKKEDTKKK